MPPETNMEKLDASIWSRLPREMAYTVIDESDLQTQIEWSCTCLDLFLYVSNKIWRHLHLHEVTRSPWKRRLRFLLEKRRYWPTEEHARISYGTELTGPLTCARKNTPRDTVNIALALPPLDHVRCLDIGLDASNGCTQSEIMDYLRALCRRCARLIACSFMGPLYQTTLLELAKIETLRSLSIRIHVNNREEALVAPGGDFMPQDQLVLNFGVLSRLRTLRCLEIGDSVRQEAHGLARSLATLDLEELTVVCCTFEFHD